MRTSSGSTYKEIQHRAWLALQENWHRGAISRVATISEFDCRYLSFLDVGNSNMDKVCSNWVAAEHRDVPETVPRMSGKNFPGLPDRIWGRG